VAALLHTRALPDAVYDVLLDMLVWGQLPSDSSLAIDRLARDLQVSQTPIREALARLETTGLVIRTARRGYRVAPPLSAEEMAELVDARIVLETGAITRAMDHREALISDLERAEVRHRESGAKLTGEAAEFTPANVRTYFEDDWAFHEGILANCGNRYIERAAGSLQFHAHRMRQTIGVGTSDAPVALAEHAEILAAVQDADRQGAVDALHHHLSNVKQRSAG
jgi:DNA-binding GntR family transcriptional regulator